jgi:DNA repair protein RadC
VEGIGEAAVAALKTVQESARRLLLEEASEQPVLTSWDKLLAYCRAQLAHETVENFHVLFLDRKNRLIAAEHQQRGTVDHTQAYPREVVKRALDLGASALILVHNHPSGNPEPSRADIAVTLKIAEAGRLLGIAVHDHVIIGQGRYVSLKAKGLI